MPSITIHVRRPYSEAEQAKIMDAAHAALVETFDARPNSRNIIFTVHEPGSFICPTDRDDATRYTNVSIVAHAGRTMEAKRRLYKAIIDNFERLGIPRNCVLIQLHELPAENIAVHGGHPLSDLIAREPT